MRRAGRRAVLQPRGACACGAPLCWERRKAAGWPGRHVGIPAWRTVPAVWPCRLPPWRWPLRGCSWRTRTGVCSGAAVVPSVARIRLVAVRATRQRDGGRSGSAVGAAHCACVLLQQCGLDSRLEPDAVAERRLLGRLARRGESKCVRGRPDAASFPIALAACREAGESRLNSTAGFAKPMLVHLAGVSGLVVLQGGRGREPARPVPCMCRVCRSRCLCLRQAAPDALLRFML